MPPVPVVDADGVRLQLDDRPGRLAGVRLVPEFDLGQPAQFARSAGAWHLRLERPPVARMEYLLELADHNGHEWTITDPGNPRRKPGAFGPKSELRFPGYREPIWLHWHRTPAEVHPFEHSSAELDGPIGGELWSPQSLPAEQPAPLLVVHDGPEYARLGRFTEYLSAGVARGVLPPLRAALLGPADRNGWYSANPRYAAALAELFDALPPASVRIGVGVSLGALAVLHAHTGTPFDGLLLQSGSFFMPDLDPQERDFSGFPEVTGFVASIPKLGSRPVPTVLTCGVVEENLANNRAMARTLTELGYPARLVEVPDAHNFTAWRDALHPNLTGLLAELVTAHAA